LNEKTFDPSAITPFSIAKCDVSFEFGAAEGITFNYLDQEEVERFQQSIAKKALPILDLFCVIRYHIVKKGKRVPLKFDYHLLRLIFYKNNMELQVIHERGSQRVSLEDLITFMEKRINEQLSKRGLKLLNLKELRTA